MLSPVPFQSVTYCFMETALAKAIPNFINSTCHGLFPDLIPHDTFENVVLLTAPSSLKPGFPERSFLILFQTPPAPSPAPSLPAHH